MLGVVKLLDARLLDFVDICLVVTNGHRDKRIQIEHKLIVGYCRVVTTYVVILAVVE